MVDQTPTVMPRSTTDIPAVTVTQPAARNTTTVTTNTTTTTNANTSASPRQNDEVTRGIYNLKMVLFLLLLPLVLFAILLKHLLDYLFGLGLKEKDVTGKVALVSLWPNKPLKSLSASATHLALNLRNWIPKFQHRHHYHLHFYAHWFKCSQVTHTHTWTS